MHENIAAVDLAGGLVRQQPELGRGRALGGALPRRAGCALGRAACLTAWEAETSSLRDPTRRALPAGALKRVSLWVPSQSGRIRERPQRQSAIVSPLHDDLGAVLVLQPHRAADDQRAVAVRGDGDGVGGTWGLLPSRAVAKPGAHRVSRSITSRSPGSPVPLSNPNER